MDPKNFPKAPLAPVYFNLEGSERQKTAIFWSTLSKKVPKNAFFGLFFQNFARGAENLAKIGTKQCFGRARKINMVDFKKNG